MNIKRRFKSSLIRRSLDKRRSANPFIVDAAENYSLPTDADENQINSYYFSGHDLNGTSLIFRYAVRGKNKTEVWFAYRDSYGNAFINTKQHYQDEDSGVRLVCEESASEWTFHWSGELKSLSSGRVVAASFSGRLSASGKIFEFGHDIESRVLAEAIAAQKWSGALFNELKANDQTHYEQPGRIEGTLDIDGGGIEISLPAVRDHSYGRRDWNYMNKHFWLMALFEDSASLNANMVSYPALNDLRTGYYETPAETVSIVTAAIEGDVQPGGVPESFAYTAELADGRKLRVVCKREEVFFFPFNNGEYLLYEGVGTFDLDGVKGRGILEFGWNGDPKRYGS